MQLNLENPNNKKDCGKVTLSCTKIENDFGNQSCNFDVSLKTVTLEKSTLFFIVNQF